jgi:hypothetical protein
MTVAVVRAFLGQQLEAVCTVCGEVWRESSTGCSVPAPIRTTPKSATLLRISRPGMT